MTNSNPGTPWGPALPTGSKRTVEEKDLPAPSTRTRGFARPVETIDTSRPIADTMKTTTCYMCACRCGIRVHLKDGRIRYIDGNPDHPVNKGVLCGKGSAGIMNHYSPARLTKPLLRTGERGSGEFKEIEWEEALSLADRVARRHPRQRPAQAGLLHRPRPEPVLHRLVGQAVRHAELRRAWRLLLGQHGGGRAVHCRRQLLGVRRSGLGAREILPDVRRRRGPRLQPDQDRHRQAEGARRQVRVGEPGADRLLRRRRRMDRPAPRHRRAVRAVAGARAAAGRPRRSGFPRPLHQRRLAGGAQSRRCR